MSTQRQERVPALTLGWRLKMALHDGDVSRAEMAEHLGVDPGTLSRWMSDKGAPPKRAYLMQWAMATDVSMEWLESGVEAPVPPGPPDGRRDQLSNLTEQKRGRTRGAASHGDTAGYLVAA